MTWRLTSSNHVLYLCLNTMGDCRTISPPVRPSWVHCVDGWYRLSMGSETGYETGSQADRTVEHHRGIQTNTAYNTNDRHLKIKGDSVANPLVLDILTATGSRTRGRFVSVVVGDDWADRPGPGPVKPMLDYKTGRIIRILTTPEQKWIGYPSKIYVPWKTKYLWRPLIYRDGLGLIYGSNSMSSTKSTYAAKASIYPLLWQSCQAGPSIRTL